MHHPDTTLELMRQRYAELIRQAEQERLARSFVDQSSRDRRSKVSLMIDVELPWGRRVRFSAGRTESGFPT